MEGVKTLFMSMREMEKIWIHLRGRGKSMYSSYIRSFSNKRERHKPRQLEGNIQGIFAEIHAGKIDSKWIH